MSEGEWKIWKHGGKRLRQRRKVPLGIDQQTLQLRVIAVNTNEVQFAKWTALGPVAEIGLFDSATASRITHQLETTATLYFDLTG